ncbi:MAG: reverse transcriptase family protein [Candidatus Thiodiazotropha sp.]
MSWNIWGLKRKLCDIDFINHIKNYDIILLGETWLNEKTGLKCEIEGYQCEHIYARKSIGARKGRYSGGISIYYKSYLKDFIKVIEKSQYGLLWLKIDSQLIQGDTDLLVCYCYLRDKNSRVLRHEDIDLYEILENDISKYKNEGKILVTGDLNSRTGLHEQFSDVLEYDRYIVSGIDEYVWYEDIPKRVNKDCVLDFNGKRLLELCKTTELLIANGRIGQDADLGEYTFIGSNGRSVVDYLLLSRDDFEYIVNFCVSEPTEFSDHSALVFSVKRQGNLIINSENESDNTINRLIWQCDKVDNFRETLLSNRDLYNEVVLLLDDSADAPESVNNAVEKFSNLLFDDAYSHFGVNSSYSCNRHVFSNKQNAWYNDKCRNAKQKFSEASSLYKKNKSEERKRNLVQCRTKLNKETRRAKAIFKFEQGQRISKLAKTNPKSFWKSVKKENKTMQRPSDNLSTDDFYMHFSDIHGMNSDDSFSDSVNTSDTNIINDLDLEITQDEVLKVIKYLKAQKSPGMDGLIAEIFKSSADILSPILVKIFNVVFSSGCYPKSWSEGVITPIHKKGDINDVNNYRGITLINIMSKIYSHILHNRLLIWAENNEKIDACQFGFQPQKSTVDCIFLFHSILSKTLSQGEKLYCSFVDFRRAFDTVNRRYLWQKLIRDGISSRMVNSLKAMYENVKTCVKFKNRYSNFFSSNIGLKQGDPLSAILFVFFINDLIENVGLHDNRYSFSIQDVNLFMLLYADDVVLFSKSPDALQRMLDKLHSYSTSWDLTVNTEKTKIMIFENGRKTLKTFHFGDIVLDVVDSFKYLGITFYKNGNWNRSQKYIAEHGSYALHNLYRILANISLNIPEKFKLFDSLVGSVLSYASEIWGYHQGIDIERIHTRFCRSVLGVKRSTNLSALYSELGRKPLIIFRQLRMIKYWLKLRKTNNTLLKSMFVMLSNDVEQGYIYNGLNWAFQVKSILDKLGLSNLWNLENHIEISISSIKTRLLDQYNQTLMSEINNSNRLRLYSKYKKTLDYEKYLDILKNKTFMYAVSRFRLSSHKLEIETGRYIGLDRDTRFCKRCNMQIVEDEYHFLLVCPKYSDIRRKYFPPYYCHWPNINKFVTLMSSNSVFLLQK